MKYIYAYKTSDGLRHEDSMSAGSREEVFVALRKKGIKAIKVVSADGAKANGEIRGVRKRIVALLLFFAAVGTGAGVYLLLGGNIGNSGRSVPADVAKPLPRQEIKGDRQRIEKAAASLDTKAERFLAKFAEPGRAFTAYEAEWPNRAEFAAVLKKPLRFSENEFTEQIDLKRVIEGLKIEMSYYLGGGGLTSGYIRDLIKRQKMEIAEREKAQRYLAELIKAAEPIQSTNNVGEEYESKIKKAYQYWLTANAQLQAMGIYALPMPDALYRYRGSFDAEE